MIHRQISVFIENKQGRLADITQVLGDNDIDIGALCIADTKDFGILRVIVDKPDLAEKVLKNEQYAVSITEVLAISVDDKPGGLAAALRILGDCEINIEYMYHYARKNENKASMILRVNDPAEAIERLKGTPLSPAAGLPL